MSAEEVDFTDICVIEQLLSCVIEWQREGDDKKLFLWLNSFRKEELLATYEAIDLAVKQIEEKAEFEMLNPMFQDFESHPSWDYYLSWHQLIKAKSEIDSALRGIKGERVSSPSADIHLVRAVLATQKVLQGIEYKYEVVDYAIASEEDGD